MNNAPDYENNLVFTPKDTNYDILKEYEAHGETLPSYDEWKRILHYGSKYEYEYTSCVMDYENLKQENAKLKELLKEVLRHELSLKEISELTRKICQALGEDK